MELAPMAVDLLCAGADPEEPIIWPMEATPVLSAAIELVLLRGESVREELSGVLRLARALELGHRSPAAANAIYSVIEALPQALSALGVVSLDDARARGLDAALLLDAAPVQTAPVYGAPPPPGTQKLSSYLKNYSKGVSR